MKNLTKHEIVLNIYEETNIPQHNITTVVQKTLDAITKALAQGRNVEFRNFGTFEVRKSKPRIGRNPQKPEIAIAIPERTIIKFKTGKILKETLEKPQPTPPKPQTTKPIEQQAETPNQTQNISPSTNLQPTYI